MWLTWNFVIFHNKDIITFQVFHQIRFLYEKIWIASRPKPPTIVHELIIDWVNGIKELQTLVLKPVYRQVMEMIGKFMDVTYTHAYRELNCQVDSLSKQGLEMIVGTINITEGKDGSRLPPVSP